MMLQFEDGYITVNYLLMILQFDDDYIIVNHFVKLHAVNHFMMLIVTFYILLLVILGAEPELGLFLNILQDQHQVQICSSDFSHRFHPRGRTRRDQNQKLKIKNFVFKIKCSFDHISKQNKTT